MNSGSIVRCRNRDCVLLPSESPGISLLRPLTSAIEEVVAIDRRLSVLVVGTHWPATARADMLSMNPLLAHIEPDDCEDINRHEPTQPSPGNNPLEEHPFVFYDNAVRFDDPGRYGLLLLADENEVARHPLKILPAGAPNGGVP